MLFFLHNPKDIFSDRYRIRKPSSGSERKTFTFSILTMFTIVILFGFLNICTDTFTSKEEFVRKAQNCELGAYRQEKKYMVDGDVNRLYGKEEYLKDAIEYYYKAISVSGDDIEFDKKIESKIKLLRSQLNR